MNHNGEEITATTSMGMATKPRYLRTTELRHLRDNDIFKLARMLDENDCWLRLMRIIPKRLNAHTSSANGALNYDEVTALAGLKYNSSDIRLIESAFERMPMVYQSISQIMIDEWKTSGRTNERPTLGVLLQLLTHAELFRAADFVAIELLNEPKPPRPKNGPAEPFELSSLSAEICENMDVDFDGEYMPSTRALNENAQGAYTEVFNKDFYSKNIIFCNKNIPNQINENGVAIPTPSACNSHHNIIKSPTTATQLPVEQSIKDNGTQPVTTETDAENVSMSHNIPNLSMLRKISASSMTNTRTTITGTTISTTGTQEDYNSTLSKVNDLVEPDAISKTNQNISMHMNNTAPIPQVTLLLNNMENSQISTASIVSKRSQTECTDCLPVISALNLLGERSSNQRDENASTDDSDERSSSLSPDVDDDDDDDEEEEGATNIQSNFEQRSSNNDSSLTTVTGTSGENSFELTNDSSSQSNDENIPCLSALQP